MTWENRTFKWAPQPDITAFELAQCMPMFVFCAMGGDAVQLIYNKLPPECKRHWEVRES